MFIKGCSATLKCISEITFYKPNSLIRNVSLIKCVLQQNALSQNQSIILVSLVWGRILPWK